MLKEFLRQNVSASREVVRPPKADKQTRGGKKVKTNMLKEFLRQNVPASREVVRPPKADKWKYKTEINQVLFQLKAAEFFYTKKGTFNKECPLR